MKTLTVTKGHHISIGSESFMIMVLHDLLRLFYVSVYFYLFPFAVLGCSAYYSLFI